jgi:hypothetical protein
MREIPNPKIQAPKKFQKTKLQKARSFGAWDLELGASLGFGA